MSSSPTASVIRDFMAKYSDDQIYTAVIGGVVLLALVIYWFFCYYRLDKMVKSCGGACQCSKEDLNMAGSLNPISRIRAYFRLREHLCKCPHHEEVKK